MKIDFLLFIASSLDDNFLDLDACFQKEVLESALCIAFGFFKDTSAERFLNHLLSSFFSELIFHIYFAFGYDTELSSLQFSGKRYSENFRFSEDDSDCSITGDLDISRSDVVDSISSTDYSFYLKGKCSTKERTADDLVYSDIRE